MNKPNAVDKITGEPYYCPYCVEGQTKFKPAQLEPHWTLHRLYHGELAKPEVEK